jgi:tetratricopeptide (TPR) repeat protein
MFNWASLLHAEGRLTEADKYLRRALLLTDDRERTASITLKLGAIERDKGNYAAAEQLYQQALKLYTELKGANALAASLPLIELAELRTSIGDLAGAEGLARRALAIRRTRLPAQHPDITRSEIQLARALADQGKTAEAQPLVERAVQFVRSPPFPLPASLIREAESARSLVN